MVSMYTVCAWGGLALVCSGYYYLGQKKPRRASKHADVRGRPKKEKDVKAVRKPKGPAAAAGDSSGTEAQRRTKAKKEPVGPTPVTSYHDTADDQVDDREFARQFSNAKAGTAMAPQNGRAARQKSVKLSKAMTSDDDDEPATRKAPGARGSDGDDDLSSAASPELQATVPPGGSRDPSDMLASPAIGPAILRLTDTTQAPVKPKAAAAAKPTPAPELTKKQRQNQAKNQAAKLLREEGEKERRALLEKQRRTAREAEGRAPKDGSSTLYSARAPPTSAWERGSAAVQPAAPLDTFAGSTDDASGAGGRDEAAPAPAAPTTGPASLASYSDLPSEEEQMRILNEADGWNEVKPKKSKSKMMAKAGSDNAAETADTPAKPASSKFDNFETEA